MKSIRTVAVVMLASAALLAAGCAGGGDSGGSEQPAGDTIKISTITPTETTGGNFPESIAGAQAAIRAINADGGIDGRNLELVTCNERIDINAAASCARNAENSDSMALVAAISVNSVAGVLPNLKTIPSVGPFSLSPEDMACDVCYSYDALMLGQLISTQALLDYAGVDGKVQILTLDIPAGHDSQGRSYDALKAAGVDVEPIIFVPPTTSDMSAYAQRIKDSGAAVVIPALAQQGVFALLQALQQIDYKPIILTNDSQVLPRDIDALGDFIEGALFVLSLPPASAADAYPGIQKWIDEMKAEEEAGDESAATLNGVSLHAWLGVYAIAEVAKQIDGEVNRESFTAALDAAKDVDLQGLLPPWTPSAEAPADVPPGMNQPFIFVGTVEDGALVLSEKDPFNIATNEFQPTS